jgi:membrane-associated phospholipid phosphatase
MFKHLLLHEWIFGAYLLVMAVSLLTIRGLANPDTWVFLSLLAVNAAVIAVGANNESIALWRVRLGFYVIAMNIAFQQMRTAVPALRNYRADADLQAIDSWLIGRTPSLILQGWMQPWISDVMSVCYFLYLPYIALSMLWYLFSRLNVARRFFAGLFSLYGIGFLGYLALPAAGPYLAMTDRFSKPIEGGWLTAVNAALISAGSNGIDVFPSLHCAVSCYILFFDRRFKPWRYRLYLLPCVVLWMSTVYLRYHYLVDLIAGFLLAAVSLWLSFRIHPGEEHEIRHSV